MAERVVDIVAEKLEDNLIDIPFTKTESIHLTDPYFINYRQVKEAIEELEVLMSGYNINRIYATYLIQNYGPAAVDIWNNCIARKQEDTEEALIRAELDFCYEHEMMLKPLDFIVRRTGRGYFMPSTIPLVKRIIFTYFQERMNWSALEMQENHQEWEEVMQTLHTFS